MNPQQVTNVKSILKSQIKKVNMAFDISTKAVGFCITANDMPIKYSFMNKEYPSFGSLPLAETDKTYDSFADRVCVASWRFTSSFAVIVHNILKAFSDDVIDDSLESINIVFELSLIHLKTSTQLALYVGKLSQIVSDIVWFKFPKIKKERIKYKFVSPQQWQSKYEDYPIHPDSNGQPTAKKDAWKNKVRTLYIANNQLGLWGFESTQDDDLADALNMCMVADQLQDRLEATKTSKGIKRASENKNNLIIRLMKRKEELRAKANASVNAKLTKKERDRWDQIEKQLAELNTSK